MDASLPGAPVILKLPEVAWVVNRHFSHHLDESGQCPTSGIFKILALYKVHRVSSEFKTNIAVQASALL
jgi:hypothetical protein